MGNELLQRNSSRRDNDSANDLQQQRQANNKRDLNKDSPVQLRGSAPAASTQKQPETRSAWGWTTDPWMDAAHRGTSPEAAPVQRKGEGTGSNANAIEAANANAFDTVAFEVTPLVDAAIAKLEQEIEAYLAKKLGADGASFMRSSQLRSFRGDLKGAAREQANTEIDAIVESNEEQLSGDSGGNGRTATSAYIGMDAKPRAHKSAKKSVNSYLHTLAKTQAQTLAGAERDTLTVDASQVARSIAPGVVIRDEAQARLDSSFQAARARALEKAEAWKNEIIKNPDAAQGAAAQAAHAQGARAQVTGDEVAYKSIDEALTASDATRGMEMVRKLIDGNLTQAGDQASVNIELTIPIGNTPGTVTLGLAGTAARGIDGAVTAGVPIMGKNPDHIEAQFDFTFKIGAAAFGLGANFMTKFFLRSAGENSFSAMNAMNYAAYRAASGVSTGLGNWWAGANQGTDVSKRLKAESWAAMIEQQVFDKDDEAFAHRGVVGGLDGSLELPGVAVGVEGSEAKFEKWDKDSLKKSLGDDFAKEVSGEDAAKARRAKAKGGKGSSFGAGASVDVGILGQGVSFSGSLSGSMTDFRNNWGLEIKSSVSLPADTADSKSTLFSEIAAGIVAGSMGVIKNLNAVAKGKKVGGGVDLAADIAVITNGGMKNEVSNQLDGLGNFDGDTLQGAGIGGESSIEVSLLVGRGDGQGIFRVELRSSKTLGVNLGTGNVGIKGEVSKNQRIGAVGLEEGEVRGELFGSRTKNARS